MGAIDYRVILADPPRVHGSAPAGIYNADPACCAHLAARLAPGKRSLETGLGLSTIAFAASGADHTAFFLDPEEGVTLTAWLAARDISDRALELVAGPSQATLPAHKPAGPLDVVFIDGNHAFPFPMLDFYFAARWLRPGGLLAIDDLHLPAPALLYATLAVDPRWRVDRKARRWVAFTLEEEHDFDEEWVAQGLRASAISRKLAAQWARAAAEGQPRRLLRSAYRHRWPPRPAG